MSPDDLKTVAPSTAQAKPLVQMRLAIADYDRTRPLITGRVQPEGIILKSSSPGKGDFCNRPVYEEFDVSEMSLSLYVAARARGDKVIALPIFPLRMAVLGYVFCRSDAPYKSPAELKGKRIGSIGYRYTVNLWLRGIFKDVYGLAPEDVTWVMGEGDTAGFVTPPGIKIEVHKGVTPGEMLLTGLADVVIGPEAPDEYLQGDTRIRRIFSDAQGECRAYFRTTGIYPVTHVIVMTADSYRAKPWVAQPLFDAFTEAQRLCDNFYYSNAKHVTFPDAVFFMEDERLVWGDNPYVHGVAANRHLIETFVRFAHEQGYINRRLSVEELFAESTLHL